MTMGAETGIPGGDHDRRAAGARGRLLDRAAPRTALGRTGGCAWSPARCSTASAAARPRDGRRRSAAEGAWKAECGGALDALTEAERIVLPTHRRQALFDMLAGMFGPVALLGVIGAAWWDGARGEALLVPVFLAFAWLAFETMQGVSRIVVARLRRRAAQAEIDGWRTAAPSHRRRCACRRRRRHAEHAAMPPAHPTAGRSESLALRLEQGGRPSSREPAAAERRAC